MPGKGFGEALRAPADAAAGIEDQRRLRIPGRAGRQRDRAGRAVVVEKRLPERVRQMAADQHLEVAMRPVLCAAD